MRRRVFRTVVKTLPFTFDTVLQKLYEANKTERKQRSREEKEAEKQRLFALRQQKRKEKHRGH